MGFKRPVTRGVSMDLVLDEIAAAAELLVVDAMLLAEFLFDEAEAVAEFLACVVLGEGGDHGVRSAAVAEWFGRLW